MPVRRPALLALALALLASAPAGALVVHHAELLLPAAAGVPPLPRVESGGIVAIVVGPAVPVGPVARAPPPPVVVEEAPPIPLEHEEILDLVSHSRTSACPHSLHRSAICPV